MVAIESCLSNGFFSWTQEGCGERQGRKEEQDCSSRDKGWDGLNLRDGMKLWLGSKRKGRRTRKRNFVIYKTQSVDWL